MAKGKIRNVGVLDFETDPFLHGRIPFPFACCIYFSKDNYKVIWEPEAIDKTVYVLRHIDECTLYAHNGGKFDFEYLLEDANPGTIIIRNGRIVEMRIGKVTLKDSWPLMPFALAEYKKDKVDYRIFEDNKRNIPKNKKIITAYMISDCVNLFELLDGFKKIVGPKDTIGGSAFYQMKNKFGLEIVNTNESHDDHFRPYFFGGRVEAFEKGIFKERMVYVDMNSAYSFAMMQKHPHGADYTHSQRLPKDSKLGPQFAHIRANSRGALPYRVGDNDNQFPQAPGSILFPHGTYEFFATGWEIAAGLETNTLKVLDVLDVWLPQNFICFDEYVTTFFKLKSDAKKAGDRIHELAYKYLLNSGYGKFAQNPRDFKEYALAPFGMYIDGFEWVTDFGKLSLWERPSYNGMGFYDVCTGASITGFNRARLWKGVNKSTAVKYIDTDAMLCRSTRVEISDKLGEWKIEGRVCEAAIGGKKLYGVKWVSPIKGESHKIATKGARLTYSDILHICNGGSVIWKNDAPTFSLAGAGFVEREITAT